MKTFIKNTKIKLIIFDFDGTLYPRNIYLDEYYNFALKSIMKLFDKTQEEALKILNENNIQIEKELRNGSISKTMMKLGLTIKEWNSYRDKNFDVSYKINKNMVLKNELDILRKLYSLALFSNNSSYALSKIINKLGIPKKYFSIILTSDSKTKLKPSIEGFRFIIKEYKVLSKEVLSIGDRYEIDILPVLKIGGNGILIEHEKDLLEIDKILDNLKAYISPRHT